MTGLHRRTHVGADAAATHRYPGVAQRLLQRAHESSALHGSLVLCACPLAASTQHQLIWRAFKRPSRDILSASQTELEQRSRIGDSRVIRPAPSPRCQTDLPPLPKPLATSHAISPAPLASHTTKLCACACTPSPAKWVQKPPSRFHWTQARECNTVSDRCKAANNRQ